MKNILITKNRKNRKYYDTVNSHYVNLPEIADLVKLGYFVKVVDSITREDITYRTKITILCELEKRSNIVISPFIIDEIIKSKPGTFTGFIKESL